MAELTVDLTYGKALFDAATELGMTETILEEGQALTDIFKKEPAFYEFICTPIVSAAQKKEALSNVFSGKISKELLNFLFILIDKRRTREFTNIIKRYKLILDQSQGFSTGTIFSATPLSAEQISTFEEKTGKLIQKKVRLENKTDTTIIGGIRIFIEGKVIDATIKKRLKDLEETLR